MSLGRDPFSEVAGIFAIVLETDPEAIDPIRRFHDELGGDSLQKMEVAVRIEKLFGVALSDAVICSADTVSDFVAAVRAGSAAS